MAEAKDGSSPNPAPDRQSEARFLADGLKAWGAAMAVLCGICTLTFAAPNLFAVAVGDTGGYALMFLQLSLLVGVAPCLVGFGLYALGARLARESPKPIRRDLGPPVEVAGVILTVVGVLATAGSALMSLGAAFGASWSVRQWAYACLSLAVPLLLAASGYGLTRLGAAWSKIGR